MSLEIPLAYTPATLTEEIYKLVKSEGMSYIDAIIQICDANDIEYSDIALLITAPIKSKIEAEGQERSILPKSNNISAFMIDEDLPLIS